MEARSPVRVVLDRHLRLSPARACWRARRATTPVWVVATPARRRRRKRALRAQGVEVIRARTARSICCLLTKLLAGRGITRLMVEGGPTIAAAFLKADLVDEAVLFRAPARIGPERH